MCVKQINNGRSQHKLYSSIHRNQEIENIVPKVWIFPKLGNYKFRLQTHLIDSEDDKDTIISRNKLRIIFERSEIINHHEISWGKKSQKPNFCFRKKLQRNQ